MITANEARTIISNIKKQEQEAIEKAIEKFLNEDCNSAITFTVSSTPSPPAAVLPCESFDGEFKLRRSAHGQAATIQHHTVCTY